MFNRLRNMIDMADQDEIIIELREQISELKKEMSQVLREKNSVKHRKDKVLFTEQKMYSTYYSRIQALKQLKDDKLPETQNRKVGK